MLGQKIRDLRVHRALSLEQLVPQDNFYRQLSDQLDLRFVYQLVKDAYAPTLGRPSIDPIVFFKLQLIMFFEGIRSDRPLMETVNLNLAHRWYIGYDLDEPVPDHSSLSKIRTRYGLAVFQRFFEQVVELCVDAGLVWGKELYFDGTKIRANAAVSSLVPRWYWKAKQHVQSLFDPAVSVPSAAASSANSTAQPSSSKHVWLVNTYDGHRQPNQVASNYQRATDLSVSTTDPDASPMNRFPGDQTHLGYHTHYVVDGGKARIILAALVTPASVQDNTPMLDLARWVRFRWHLKPRIAVGDTRYGTIANIVGLEQDGLQAYLPIADHRRPEPFYPAERFRFDAERECYVCPQDQVLLRHSRRQRDQVVVYRAKPAVCNACPVKAECTASRSGRHIFRSIFQDYVDRVRAYHATPAYQKALGKRMVWVEPLFAEIKQWHHLSQFRLRGLHKVNVEGLIAATGQNLKRLLNHWRRERTRASGAIAARLFIHTFLFLRLARSVFELQAKRLFQQAGKFHAISCVNIARRI